MTPFTSDMDRRTLLKTLGDMAGDADDASALARLARVVEYSEPAPIMIYRWTVLTLQRR